MHYRRSLWAHPLNVFIIMKECLDCYCPEMSWLHYNSVTIQCISVARVLATCMTHYVDRFHTDSYSQLSMKKKEEETNSAHFILSCGALLWTFPWNEEQMWTQANRRQRHTMVINAVGGQVFTEHSLDLCQIMSTCQSGLGHAWLTADTAPETATGHSP